MSRMLDPKGINEVLSQYNQTQAYFPGTEATPILKEVSREETVELLNNATTNEPVSAPSQDLLGYMRKHQWCITAGVHQGGLGGAAGGADPESHISVAVNGHGYHLRVMENKTKKLWILWDITGPAEGTPGGIRLSKGKAAAAARVTPPTVTLIDEFQRNFALTEKEALRAVAHKKKTGCGNAQAVAWLKNLKK